VAPQDSPELLTLRGHKSPINWVAFTPDGRTLVSAADDGLRFWNVATWRPIGAFEDGQRRQLLTIANSGNIMATCDAAVPNAPISLVRASELEPALHRRSSEARPDHGC
jgi:WD40 repeat protein